VFQWAVLYHLGMKAKNNVGFQKIRPIFIVSNVSVIIVVVLLFLSIVHSETRHLALIGAIILAIIMIICGITFLIYGTLLARHLRRTTKKTNSISRNEASSISSFKGNHVDKESSNFDVTLSERVLWAICCLKNNGFTTHKPLWIKMYTASVVVAICFCMESVMQIMSIVQLGDTWSGEKIVDVTYTSTLYVFELIALFTILIIYKRTVDHDVRKKLSDHHLSRTGGGDGPMEQSLHHSERSEPSHRSPEMSRSERSPTSQHHHPFEPPLPDSNGRILSGSSAVEMTHHGPSMSDDSTSSHGPSISGGHEVHGGTGVST